MRVCPKCGFVDPPEWRHSKYSYWIDHCLADDFKTMNPELHKQLMAGVKLVEDENYVYRMTKTKRHVERKAKVDYGYQWNIPMEKVKHGSMLSDPRSQWFKELPSKKQKKLLEDSKEMGES